MVSSTTINNDGSAAVDKNREQTENIVSMRGRSFTKSPSARSCSTHNILHSSENPTFPADCYSFLTLHGPFSNPKYFFFGLTVFALQFMFLILLVLSVVHPKMSANGDVDNPGKGWIATFIPANASIIVRATQITALVSFVIFADSSLQDAVIAVVTFPKRNSLRLNGETGCRVLSCCLRGLQGGTAILAAFLLVMISSNVVEIILNFTAVNFISTLDDSAFELVKSGKFGEEFKEEANKIDERLLPDDMARKNNTRVKLYWYTVGGVTVILFILATFVIFGQQRHDMWTTSTLRVQFQDKTGLQSYNGCFNALQKNENKDRRKIYESFENNTDSSNIGYCKDQRRWFFFKGKETGGYPDPCYAGKYELAHSSKTDSFDISTSFDGGWFSAFNTPLDMYFIEDENKTALIDGCNSFANDGICDPAFNNFDYEYDGGDCCAATCTKPNCGIGALTNAFGVDTSENHNDGFPSCEDPDMVNLITSLHDLEFEAIPKWARDVSSNQTEWDAFRKPLIVLECDKKMVFSVNFDKSMMNKTEISKVGDGSNCIITVNNFSPIWYANFSTVINEEGTNVTVIRQDRNSIPSEIGELASLSNLTLVDNSLTGAIPVEIGNLKDLTHLNLKSNSLKGTIPIEIGSLHSSLKELDLSNNILTGTIPTEIGPLNNLTSLNLYGNSLTGTIPIEIGSSNSSLKELDLSSNFLTGTIPTEIGLLTLLTSLDLLGNSLTGIIPTEIELLTDLRSLNLLDNPSLTGPIDCSKFLNLENIGECEDFNPTASPTLSTSPSGVPSRTASPSKRTSRSPSENPSAGPSISPVPGILPLELPSSKLPSEDTPSVESSAAPNATSLAPSSPSASPSPGPTACNTIENLLCEDESNGTFSTLCELIKSNNFNLTDEWSDENINWTVFAPTNDAFKRLIDTLDGGIFDVPEDLLKHLQFHAVKGEKLLSTDLPCEAGENVITMSNGKDARIKCEGDSPYGIKGKGNNNVAANFTDVVDVIACNGVIHVIDDVLLFEEL